MKKFKKLITVLTIISIILILGQSLNSLAVVAPRNYMDLYTKKDSAGKPYYLTINETDKKNLIDVTSTWAPDIWNDGENSDYPYVINNAGVWCLAHTQVNATGGPALRIKGIIEIGTDTNPLNTKIFGKKSSSIAVKNNVGGSNRDKADAAFTMLVGKNYSKDNVTGIAQSEFIRPFISSLDELGLGMFKKGSETGVTSNTITRNGVKYGITTSTSKGTVGYSDEIDKIHNTLKTTDYKNLTVDVNNNGTAHNCNKSNVHYAHIKTSVPQGTTVFDFSNNSKLVKDRQVIIKSESGTRTYTLKLEQCSYAEHSKHWYLYNGNQLAGRLDMDGDIFLFEDIYKPGNDIENFEVKVRFDYIHAVLYLLGTNSTQTRGISLGEWKTGEFSTGNISIINSTTPANVSMQKYITKVNGEEISNSRENQKTVVGDSTVKDGIKTGVTASDNYKGEEENIVAIGAGDTVTYRVCIYNNGNSDATNVEVVDRLPYYYKGTDTTWNSATNKGIAVDKNNIVIKDNKGNFYTWNAVTNSTNGCTEIRYTIPKLAKSETKYFDIALKFDKELTGSIVNTAWINCKNNETSYRTTDRDYIVMKGYSVSLEKYISKVNGENIDTYSKYRDLDEDGDVDNDDAINFLRYATALYNEIEESILDKFNNHKEDVDYNGDGKLNSTDSLFLIQHKFDRRAYRHNDGTFTDTIPNIALNRRPFKKNNPVEIEPGDIITYNILLENTGDNTVNIKQIYDSFINIKTGTYNGLKLEFDEEYGIQGCGKYTIKDYAGASSNNEVDTKLIEFIDPITLEGRKEVNLTMQFKAVVPTGSAMKNELTLVNKAGIVRIENSMGNEVTDGDGTDNNYDMDWAKTKTYSVSLEKYVTEVTDPRTTVNSRENDPIYNPSGSSKESNPVKLEVGDTVKYKIKVKNTSDTPVKITKILDTSDSRLECKQTSTTGTKGSVYTIRKSKAGEYWLESTNAKLLAKDEVEYIPIEFSVVVPQNQIGTVQKLINTAEIKEMQNSNGTAVPDTDLSDNEDSDWVETKIYSVSLEKYITKVTDKDGGNVRNITGRNGHPIYDDNNYKQPNKTPGPVEVEPGDLVTYTIKLTNTNKDTSVKIPKIIDDSKQTTTGLELEYVGKGDSGVDFTKSANEITLTNPTLLGPGASEYITLVFRVKVVPGLTGESRTLVNTAQIVNTSLVNRNGSGVVDSERADGYGERNNTDSDWVKTKTYKVSLEKYISKVNDQTLTAKQTDKVNRNGVPQYTSGRTKYDNIVKVSNGDKVTYTIKVKNDGDTSVKISEIADYLPNGVKHDKDYTGKTYCTSYEHKSSEQYDSDGRLITKADNGQTGNIYTFSTEEIIEPGDDYTFPIDVFVIEPNISINVLKNVAEIIEMKNRNGVTVVDTTPDNNKDADYIILDFGEREEETIEYTVEKKWEGTTEAAPVTVKLFKVKGSEEIDLGMESIELSEVNEWTYTWIELPKFEVDSEGKPTKNEIVYTARELNSAGEIVRHGEKYNDAVTAYYNPTTPGKGVKKVTITNESTGIVEPPDTEKIEYTVEKVWVDEENPNRPTSITVRLYKYDSSENLTPVGNTITLDNSSWTYTWTDLDKYEIVDENEVLVRYTVRELNGGTIIAEDGEYNGYKVNYLEEQDKTTITNTLIKEEPEEPEPESDLAIGGMVWNDLALDKAAKDYNGYKDEQETFLAGIKVTLYREGKGKVAETVTDENGEYYFTNESLEENQGKAGIVTLKPEERFIKGPKATQGTKVLKRWAGTYYTYYVVFEYDGITYTSVQIRDIFNNEEKYNEDVSDYKIDSNAKEDEGKRKDFNKDISDLVNEAKIDYAKINKNGYKPQSIHKYDATKMNMQSSTVLINLANFANEDLTREQKVKMEDQIQYVNLGLKGREVFDLELRADVYSTQITVNGVVGPYNYNDNRVTLRKDDANNYNYVEDAANVHLDGTKYVGEEYEQGVRETDINNVNYGGILTDKLGIEVTYRVIVQNTASTKGKVLEIVNYYDEKYKFKEAKSSTGTTLTAQVETTGDGYESRKITTPTTELATGDNMEIYITYELENAAATLNSVEMLPTFNMFEITKYETIGEESTKGLIDKDSEPNSVKTENVNIHPDQIIDNVSTVDYYFSKGKDLFGDDYLLVLKYEDDTYAAPTLYFVKSNSPRVITGTVFEDSTVVDATTRIKTGNGKLDEGEVGIYGATVQLIEQVGSGVERYTITTGKDGKFEFKGFLPGNYIIKYQYGDTINTALIGQGDINIPINSKSYNGEDFQSTNNKYEITGMDTNILNPTTNFWYSFNEKDGISTARDDTARRIKVSETVSDPVYFDDDKMMVLNNIRDLVGTYNSADGGTLVATKKYDLERTGIYDIAFEFKETGIDEVINDTKMFATTEPMFFTVEETVDLNQMASDEVARLVIEELLEDKGNNLGEWRMFPEEGTAYESYTIINMNFGIAEVPVTTLDLSKKVSKFSVTDSTGENLLAKAGKNKETGNWEVEIGIIDPSMAGYGVQIEDEKLQGARLEIEFDINGKIELEKNYDNTFVGYPTINYLADFVSNNLSYNPRLGTNEAYWDIASISDISSRNGSSIDGYSSGYTTILKAKTGNPLLELGKDDASLEKTATIVLEKILSSTDATIDQIITSTVQSFEFSNTAELIELDYTNTKIDTNGDDIPDFAMRDRIRTSDRYIIIPGKHHDTVSSEIISIFPPTGDTSVHITYYIIAAISLAVLAIGAFGIKKFVIKKQ